MATTTFVNRQTPIMAEWLNDVDAHVYNDTDKVQNMLDYYTNDAGAALQAAHDALGPDGGTIYVPSNSSYYTLTTGAVFTKPIRVVGDGWYNSEILSNTANVVFISSSSKLDVAHLSFTALTSARGACVFIKQLAASTNHSHSCIENNYFDGASRCYWSERTNGLMFKNNLVGAVGGYGLYLENTTNSDEGDSFLTNNTFAGDTASINIYVPSTSGINVVGNKFNNAVIGHVLISVGANDTGNFLFSANSFEGHDDYGIKLLASTGVVTKTLITGNQFSSDCNNHIVVGAKAYNTSISGNTFNSTSNATANAIILETDSLDTIITGNHFYQILSAITCSSSTNLGLTLDSNRYADDITTIFTGNNGLVATTSTITARASKLISNASNASYVNAIRLIGYGEVTVRVYGVIQGSGNATYYKRVLVHGDTPTDIDTAVTAGSAFDVQVAASGGYLVVGIKRNGATGTSTSCYVDVEASGQLTTMEYV